MPSANNSPIPFSACNGNKPTTWRSPHNELIKNDSSVNNASSVLLSLSDSIGSSAQCFYSDVVLLIPPTLNHNSYTNNNIGVFHDGLPSSSQGLSNGDQKPYYKEEINNVNINGAYTCSQGGYGYQYGQKIRPEQWSNSYRGSSGCVPPYMQFPREQPQLYMVSTMSTSTYPTFISNVVPSNWYNIYEVPNKISYFPFDAYNNSASLQLQYFCGPSFVPHQTFYSTLQSNFTFLLVNLRAKLQKQIEYYFSSKNLPTDYYLKKHMDDHG